MRSPGCGGILALALLAPTVAAEPGAGARLAYARTELAARCPDEASLRAAVAKRLGYDPFLAAARQTIIVDISLEQEELVGRVRLVDASGVVRGSRDLRSSAADCEELAASLALAISITLDPSAAFDLKPPGGGEAPPEAEPASQTAAATGASESTDASAGAAQSPEPATNAPGAAAAPPPKASPDAATSPFELALRGGGLVAAGVAPSLNLGMWAGVGFGRGMLRGSLELRADFPASKQAPSGGRVHSSLLAGNLSACLARGWAAFCLAGSLGQRNTSASEVPNARSESVLFAAMGGRLEARLALVDGLWFLTSVEAMGVFTPLTLRLDEQDVWSSPPIVAALQLGVQYELL